MRGVKLGAVVVVALLCGAWEPFWRDQPEVEEGREAYQAKKWAEALDAFKRAGKEIPDTPELHLNRGNVLYQQALAQKPAGRWPFLEKARAEFESARTFDPAGRKADAYHNLGAALTQLALLQTKVVKGKPEPHPLEERIGLAKAAIDAFKKTLDLRGEDRAAKYNLEVAQRLLDRLEKEREKRRKEQEKKDQQKKKDDQKKDQQKKKDDQKKDQQKKKDGQKKDQQKKKDGQKKDQQKKDPQKKQQKGQPKGQQPKKAKPKKAPPLDLAPLEALKNSEKPLQLYRLMLDPKRPTKVDKDW